MYRELKAFHYNTAFSRIMEYRLRQTEQKKHFLFKALINNTFC